MWTRSKALLASVAVTITVGIVGVPHARARAFDQNNRDSCNGLDATLPGILDRIDDLLMAVPSVPLEEAAYHKSERDAAMGGESSPERIQFVMARPYYYIWFFRDDLNKARGEISEAIKKEGAETNPAARIYDISPFITTASRLQRDFNDLITHFLPGPLNAQQSVRLANGIDEIPVVLSRYIGCQAWMVRTD